MGRKFTEIETLVKKIGKPDDYVNLPIIKNDIAIGVVKEVIEIESYYKLRIIIFNGLSLETDNAKPIGIIVN